MRTARMLALACTITAATLAGEARAQGSSSYLNTYSRPTVSPYLNLLNTNQFGISSYQTLVRPQLEEREAIQRNASTIQGLQQQFQQAQSQGQGIPNYGGGRGRYGGGGTTGHPTQTMFYSHYYNLRPR